MYATYLPEIRIYIDLPCCTMIYFTNELKTKLFGYSQCNLSYRMCNECTVRITKVSKVTRLQTRQSRLQIPAGERGFFLLLIVHTSLPFNKEWCTFLGVKCLKCDAHHSPPSSAEIKYKESYTFYSPHMCS